MAFAGSVHDASAVGDTRTLTFHHTHSGEDLTVTFKSNGRYDDEGLKKLNWLLRDWRSQDQTRMNPQLFDIIWEVNRDVDGKEPIQIISAYRAPATNAMLRRRSSGVARHSQHTLGNAMDFFIPGVSLEQIRFAGLRLQRGGVGFYPTSGSPFVHLDTGSIRHWPRMNHDQLARLFPDGRTVHIPSDGNPLPGYALAQADIEKRDNGNASSSKSLFASLFGGAKSNDEDDEAPAAAPVRTASATPVSLKSAGPVPMPRARPALPSTSTIASSSVAPSYRVASADSRSIAMPVPRPALETAPQSPADIINARGFWGEEPHGEEKDSVAYRALAASAADRQASVSVTASVGQALAYAPPDRARVVAASAPMPSLRGPAPSRNPVPPQTIGFAPAQAAAATVASKFRVTQISPGRDPWLRALILTPSAQTYLSATMFGEPDMTALSSLMIKPRQALAMGFSADPQPALIAERFTGSASTAMATLTFGPRTFASR